MSDLSGKVAIVTGAGRLRGIGRDIALGFARAGADVVVTGTGRDPSTFPDDEKTVGWRDIDSVADEIRALGRRALPVVCDVTDADDIDLMVQRTVTELGRVDFLVNNAAAGAGADRVPVHEMAEDAWRRVLDVKLHGAFLASRAVARELLRQDEGGSIVNISSVSAQFLPAASAAYTAANVAIESLSATMAKELGPHGITCNSVVPGFFPTSRADYMRETDAWDISVKLISVRRPGRPEDIAGIVVYLCSPSGGFITGQAINVCGGQEGHFREFMRMRNLLEQ